jgi:hypothetical protein
VWCDGESLRYESCYGPAEVCGWAGVGVGYDCIAAGCGNGVVDAGEACDFGSGNDQRHRYRGGEGSSCGHDRQEVCDAGCGTLRTRENGLLSDCDAGDFCDWGIDCWMSGDNGSCTCG